MRITRWTESGYENGRIAARIGFPFKVPDLVRILIQSTGRRRLKQAATRIWPLGLCAGAAAISISSPSTFTSGVLRVSRRWIAIRS